MDWQGLLKWSIGTQGEFKTDTKLQPLSQEEKGWLTDALEEHNVDVVCYGHLG